MHQLDVFNAKAPRVTEVATFGNCNANLTIRLYDSNSTSSGYAMGISNNAFVVNRLVAATPASQLPTRIGIGTVIANTTLAVTGTLGVSSNAWFTGKVGVGIGTTAQPVLNANLQVGGGMAVDTLHFSNILPIHSNASLVTCNLDVRTARIASNLAVSQQVTARSFSTTSGSVTLTTGSDNAGYVNTTFVKARDVAVLDSTGGQKCRMTDVGTISATGEILGGSLRTTGALSCRDLTSTGVIYANQISACNNYGILNLGAGDITAGSATLSENLSVGGQISTGLLNITENGLLSMPTATIQCAKIECSGEVVGTYYSNVNARTIYADYLEVKNFTSSNINTTDVGGLYAPGSNVDVAHGNLIGSNLISESITMSYFAPGTSNIGSRSGSLGIYGTSLNMYTGILGTWNPVDVAASRAHPWTAIAYANPWTSNANGLFASVSSTGQIITSEDSQTWSLASNTSNIIQSSQWSDIVWAPYTPTTSGMFVAVGSNGGVMTSQDGVDWSYGASADNTANWSAVVWAPEKTRFVAIATNSVSKVMTSVDGFIWTLQTIAFTFPTKSSLAWSPPLELFVATGTAGAFVLVSTNGYVWSQAAIPVNPTTSQPPNLFKIIWSSDLSMFIAVGDVILTSGDGLTWSLRSSPNQDPTNLWRSIAWVPALSVFFVYGTTSANVTSVATSSDGVSWTLWNPPFASYLPVQLDAMAWSPRLNRLIAVGTSVSAQANIIQFNAFDFNTPQLSISKEGNIRLSHNLDITSNVYASNITAYSTFVANTITTNDVGCNINFSSKSLSNVNVLQATQFISSGTATLETITTASPTSNINVSAKNMSNVGSVQCGSLVTTEVTTPVGQSVINVSGKTLSNMQSLQTISSVFTSNIYITGNIFQNNQPYSPSSSLDVTYANNFIVTAGGKLSVSTNQQNSTFTVLGSSELIGITTTTELYASNVTAFTQINAKKVASSTGSIDFSGTTLSNISSIITSSITAPAGTSDVNLNAKNLSNVGILRSTQVVSSGAISGTSLDIGAGTATLTSITAPAGTSTVNFSTNSLSNITSINASQSLTSSNVQASLVQATSNISTSNIYITGDIFQNGQLFQPGTVSVTASIPPGSIIATNSITSFNGSNISFNNKNLCNVGVIQATAVTTTGTMSATSIAITGNGFFTLGKGELTYNEIVSMGSVTTSTLLPYTGTSISLEGNNLNNIGSISALNGTFGGTLYTSNLMVLGSTTTINSYVTANSNVLINNINGAGPGLVVKQASINGNDGAIAEFYDTNISSTVPIVRIGDGGIFTTTSNIGIGTQIPSEALDIVGSIRVSSQVKSTVPTGIAPLTVASTTLVSNLNVEMLNGRTSNFYTNASNISSGTLGVGVGGTGANTLAANKLVVGNGTNAVSTPTNLHWDSANSRLGVGSTAPTTALDVTGAITSSGAMSAQTYVSTAATASGAPFTVASTTLVTNLNVEMLNGRTSNFYTNASNISSGTLGVGVGGTGANTLAANKLVVGNGTNAVSTPTNLHWDSANSRLGVGSTAPATALDVTGAITSSGAMSAQTYTSTVATASGAPFTVTSTTLVSNLNAEMLNGRTSNFYTNASNISSGTLGVGVGGTGANTLAANKLVVGNGTNAVSTPTNLHWDSANSRLGVGSTAPTTALDVTGSVSTSNIYITGNIFQNGQLFQSGSGTTTTTSIPPGSSLSTNSITSYSGTDITFNNKNLSDVGVVQATAVTSSGTMSATSIAITGNGFFALGTGDITYGNITSTGLVYEGYGSYFSGFWYLNTSFSVATNTATTIPLASWTNMSSYSTNSSSLLNSSGYLQAPIKGIYTVTFNVPWNTGTINGIWLVHNGMNVRIASTQGNASIQTSSWTGLMMANDTIAPVVWQNNGSTVTLAATGTFNAGINSTICTNITFSLVSALN
jgi:hypothetical protein